GSLEFDVGGSPVTIQGLVDTYADSDSFESNNSFKGDLARMIFYMAVRYEGGSGEPDLEVDDFTNGGTGTFGKMSSLLAWHLLDPVDDFERRRNARIYSYQGNRNPFIDRPDWVHAVFDPNYAPLDFAVAPDTAVTVSGLAGGPFEPLQHVYAITAGGDWPLEWVVSVNVPWLFASPTEGLAAAGGRADLTVFVNAAALPSEPGSYVGTIRFQNKLTGAVLVRQIVANILTPARLAVSPSASETIRGPVGGPFNPASWTYAVSNSGVTSMDWTASGPDWLDIAPQGGRLEPGEVVTVTAAGNGVSSALGEGAYDGAIDFANATNGDGNTSRAVRLEAGTRDYLTQQFTTGTPFNLANRSVMFTPDGSADFYQATMRVVSAFPTDPTGGTAVSASDDSSTSVAAPPGRIFSFFGVSYAQLFVGSNGYLTLGSSATDYSSTPTSHFRLPRISALMTDLNPGAGGQVSYRALADRVAVTWQSVPHYSSGGSNTFQVELFDDGRIRMTWLGVTFAAPIVGLSASGGVPAGFVASDFQSYPAPTVAVETFTPRTGAPGSVVTISGTGLDNATQILFGGAPAEFTLVDGLRIEAVVPVGAISGAITVVAGGAESESATDFDVTAVPTVPAVAAAPSALGGFETTVGRPSPAQIVSVATTALPGSLVATASAGFEVSLDGETFAGSVEVPAAARIDAASNYGDGWQTGNNGGSGFGPWDLFIQSGTGAASTFIGDPAASGLTGMASAAFGLQASPESSGAFVSADRALAQPLAVGEALSFDWGINWDSAGGLKGFEIFSGSTALFKVTQNGFPGPITLYEWFGAGEVQTGLTYGPHPMRWAFRQLDAQTVRITATSREGGSQAVFTRDVPVPGAVSGLHWFVSSMEPDPRRHSF
ncbi:MAG: endonuclease, partial [Chthoniobacterales bacterium]